MMSKTGIVIVNYNSTEYLKNCLKSILSESSPPLPETVVVDNATSGFDSNQIADLYPKLKILENKKNLGFSTACNQGIRLLESEYYLLLNPDCEIQDRAIDRTRDFLESHPEIGIAGCRVINPDGTLQKASRRRIPRPSTAFYNLVGLSRLFPSHRRFASYNMGDLPDDLTHQVEAVSGSFLMFRAEVYKDTGGLDEQFFIYGEDLDFCFRTTGKGWKIYYYADAKVLHHKRRSSSTEAGIAIYHFYNAMELFYRKHFYPQAGWLERFAVITGVRLLSLVKRASHGALKHDEVGSKG